MHSCNNDNNGNNFEIENNNANDDFNMHGGNGWSLRDYLQSFQWKVLCPASQGMRSIRQHIENEYTKPKIYRNEYILLPHHHLHRHIEMIA